MIKYHCNKERNHMLFKRKKYKSYAELPVSLRDKIVLKSIKAANKDQLALVRDFEKSESRVTTSPFF